MGGGGGGGGRLIVPLQTTSVALVPTVLGTVAPTPTVLGAETSCGLYLHSFIRLGYKKNDASEVRKLQTFLNDYQHANLPVTGYYGLMTERAVRKFQVAHPAKILTPWDLTEGTGIVYLTTKQEINNIMCPALNLPIPTNLIPFSQNPEVVK